MRFEKRVPTGYSYYLVIFDVPNNVVFDWNSNTWVALGSAVTPGLAMTLATVGSLTMAHVDLNLATICLNTTPRDISVSMYRQAAGSPAPTTDLILASEPLRVCCGYELPANHLEQAFEVDITANLTTTSGNSMHFTAELRRSGQTIPLHTLDTGATCAFSVTQDAVTTGGARVSEFVIAAGTVGAANADSRFEAEYTNPNLTANRCFTVVATINTGGVTYTGTCKFTTF